MKVIVLCFMVFTLLLISACSGGVSPAPEEQVTLDALSIPYQKDAYAFADVGHKGVLNPMATFSSQGEISSSYLGTGKYKIVLKDFTNLFTNALVPFYGNVQVTAKAAAAANCKLVTWKAIAKDVTIEVSCRSLNRGLPKDSAFSILALQPSSEGTMSYAYVDSDERHMNIPAPLSYSSSGRDVTVFHDELGSYDVWFANEYNSEPVNVQITAVGSSGKFCQLEELNQSATTGSRAHVTCYDVDGRAADSAFSILALWPESMPTQGGFTTTRNISSSQFYLTDDAVTHNLIRHDVFSRNYQQARYNVKFEGHKQLRNYAYSGGLGSLQVTAVHASGGSRPVHCQIENWRFSHDGVDLWASVNCYGIATNTYSRAPSAFSILALVPPADLSIPKDVQVQVMSLEDTNTRCSTRLYGVSFESNDSGVPTQYLPTQYVRAEDAKTLRPSRNWSPTFTTNTGERYHDVSLTAFSLEHGSGWCGNSTTDLLDTNPEASENSLRLRVDLREREVFLLYRTARGFTYQRQLGAAGDLIRLVGDNRHGNIYRAEISFKVNIQDLP